MQVTVEGASDFGGDESGVEEQLEVRVLCEGHCGLPNVRVSGRCEVGVETG